MMPSSARDVVEMIKIEVEGQKAAAGFQWWTQSWWGGGRCAGIAGRSAPPSGMAFEAGVEAGSTRFVNPIAEFGASPEASFDEVVAQSLGAPAFDADHTWSMRDVMALDASGRRAHKLSAAQMILNNRDAVTEQEKNDLTHAFQAVDMDSSGRITHSDFALMMKVMGCELSEARVADLIGQAKDGFAAWRKMADEENVARCRKIWDEFDANGDNEMDLHEVNCVITRLKELGSKPEPMTEHEMGRFTNSAMSFDEFSAWFLKHEGLPHELTSTVGEPVEVLGARHRKRKRALDLAAKPFRASLHVVGYVGYYVTKTASKVVRHSDDAVGGEAWLRANMADRTVLVFPEWAFMMRAGLLRHVLEDGLQWHERVKVVQRLRVAFDYNDVDGNNQLELDELETVAIRMNPKARLAPADIAAVWAMLNPEGLPSINFSSFVKGMLKLQEHPELSQVVPLDIPHRFTLLSLVIDSPINDDQEKLIFDQMNPLERIGVGVLRRCKPKEMDKPQLHRKVADGCEGLLHYLTDEQRSAVYWTHWSCVAQACLIGVVFTALPGLIENYLGWWFETDGLTNAYWTCPGTVHDHAVAAGSFAAPFDQVVSLPVCPYGTCTSIPANLTEFLLMGGRGQSGRGAKVGNWTNQLRPLVTECGLRNQDRCIAADWEAQESCAVSAWGPCNAPEVDPLGCSPLPATSWSAEDRRFIYFNVLNLTSVVIFIVFELSSLMYTAVRSAVLVSGAIDLRLVPLNNERAFVANMLVRAAFEMGDPEGELLGVNAATRLEKEEKHLVTSILAAIWYKGKAVITGVVLKKLTVIFFPWETAMFLKPYSGVMLATALWDSMTCHAIMKGAELRAIGVSTGIEVFNDIMDTFCPNFEADRSSLSDLASVQLLRAIGVGIVYHGSMFPTMQILLRHAVAYLNMQTHIAVSSSDEPRIDSEEEFIRDFDGLTLPETRAVLCVHMLTIVLDGSMSLSKLALWHHILERVESIYQAFVVRFDSLTVEELREFIVARQPLLVGAVARIPMETEEERKKRVVWDDAATTIQAAARGYLVRDSNRTKGKKGTKDGQHNNRSDHSDNRGRTVRDLRSGASGYRYATKKESEEMKELRVLARVIPRPDTVTFKAVLIPDVVCQRFRYNEPVTTKMLLACFDPEENLIMRATTMNPGIIIQHLWREFTYKALLVLTAQDPFVVCRES